MDISHHGKLGKPKSLSTCLDISWGSTNDMLYINGKSRSSEVIDKYCYSEAKV